jgi:endoglucanase
MAEATGNARSTCASAATGAISRRELLAGSAAALLLPTTASIAAPKSQVPPSLLDALATGFNLPNVCDVAPADAELPELSVLSAFNQMGFRHIRLPIDPANCVRGESDFVRILDTVIDRILASGFALSFDMHAGDVVGKMLRDDPTRGGNILATALCFVAARAKNLPTDLVAIELLNEPPIEPAIWRPLRQSLVAEVRRIAPSHTLIWSAAQNQTVEETMDDPGPDDRNSIAAVHYYYPMVFTHQGQTWGDSPFTPIKALPFPFAAGDTQVAAIRAALAAEGRSGSLTELDAATQKPWTEDLIDADFRALSAWSRAKGWPVIVNEFGVFREFAPHGGRIRWLSSVRRAAESNGFGWCHWDFDKGFGLTGSRTDLASVDTDVVAALVDSTAPVAGGQ